jgi:hypothetical protein
MTQPFGAYLQCHKQPLATYKCLESFRSFYPDSTIVLLSDNGYDYTEMAKYFNCIYIHENENIWLTWWDLNDKGYFMNSYKMIDRMNRILPLIREDYVMWIEDDVSINSKIDDEFRFDLNGFCPNSVSNFWNINELSKKYPFLNINADYRFSGHGGSVFHKNNFITYLKNKDIIDDILENWIIYKFPTSLGQDFFFSMIILLSNGTIGSYKGHYDGFHYKDNNISVQHQYKVWYNHDLPEELCYLINKV